MNKSEKFIESSKDISESPNARAERLLLEIENERFNTMDDPGIHGIKKRLKSLGFVKVVPECCSGHPRQIDIRKSETGEKYLHLSVEHGYVCLLFSPDDQRSRELYERLKDVNIIKEKSGVFFSSHNGFQPFEEKRPERYQDFNDELSIGQTFRVDVWGDEAKDIASVLRDFWMKVSGIISQFEGVPVREQLESWYFGCRSNYGKMEITHPAFQTFGAEIERRKKNKRIK